MLQIRKIVHHYEEVLIEGGRPADPPWTMMAVAAVVANPWAGKGFVEDLRSTILRDAPGLGDVMVPRLLELAGGPERIEAYGKAAVVGVNGEVEHASGLIHTLRFGNKYREAVDGKTFLAFTNKRAGPGTAISIPMMHKHDEGFRSHYLTVEFHIIDAPAADEVVIALGAGVTGRPHHRIGDRYQDMADMQTDQTGRKI
jgi:hypothetical protein